MTTPSVEPESALLLKPEWAHAILHNGKDIELRSTPCPSKVGKTVAIGTGGMLLGQVEIVGCWLLCHGRDGQVEDHPGNPPFSTFRSTADRHQVYDESIVAEYKNIWAWELKHLIVYSTPKPYFHPKGAIVWIDLTKQRDGKPLVKREPEQRIRQVKKRPSKK
eukprot:s1036_g22.t1